jgi:DNA-binding IclR family transcriptional regulator
MVLDAVGEKEKATASELATYLDMAISTVHKHLQTLEKNGMVINRDGVYQLGLKLFHLGTKAKQRDSRLPLAREKIYEIADQTSEVVNFSVKENGRAITLFDSLNTSTLEGFQQGQFFYLHSSAAGKAMLAEMPTEDVEEVIDQWGLPQLTEHTTTSREALYDELEQIRERGYAVNNEEAWESMKAVAVPVHDGEGNVFGAMDISGPPYRLPDERELAKLLQEGVKELEASLAAHTDTRTDE